MASDGRAERRHEVTLLERLDEISEDTGGDRLLDDGAIRERRQHHDRDRLFRIHPARGLDAVELRHPHVEQRDVGTRGARELDRFLAVARLRADDQPVFLEHAAQIEADDRLILGDEHAQRADGRFVRVAAAHDPPLGPQKKPPGARAPEGNSAFADRNAATGSTTTVAAAPDVRKQFRAHPHVVVQLCTTPLSS